MRYSVANKDICQRSVTRKAQCLVKCHRPELRVGSAGMSNAELAERCVLTEVQSSGLRSQPADGKAIGCHAHSNAFLHRPDQRIWSAIRFETEGA